ncbi:MAG: transcriptional repressor [Actinomycetota bacterium]|nr:transcriptional repressor [Actinomycetota bacterium]
MATEERPRATRQRLAIREALDRAAGFRTAQELHDDLKASGERVGLTTVYRTLQALAETGGVDVLRRSDGEAIYRRCSTDDHHHHLICRQCGTSVEVASQQVEEWAADTARRHGFTNVEHLAELYGVCGVCAGPAGDRTG